MHQSNNFKAICTDNKQKIVFVHLFNGFTGSPKVLRSVIESTNGYKGILITNNTEGFLSRLDIPTFTFQFDLSSSKIVTLYSYLIAQFSIFFLVLKLCNKNDILYINTTIPMFASFAGKIKRATIIFHLHEDRSCLNFVHRSLSKLRRYFCDVEIFVSDYLMRNEHLKGKKSYVLPNVVPAIFFEEGKKKDINTKKDKNFNVLMICSLKKYKGVFEFLKIADKLMPFSDVSFSRSPYQIQHQHQ